MKKIYSLIIILAITLLSNKQNFSLFAQMVGKALPCHVNVNNPVNQGFDDPIRATVRIVFYDWDGTTGTTCSGVLLNVIGHDGITYPVVATAGHCVYGAPHESAYDWDLSKTTFIFNYQSPTMSNGDVPNQVIKLTEEDTIRANDGEWPKWNTTGQRLRYVHKGGCVNAGRFADLVLLKLNRPIPPHFNPYYAGWSATPAVLPNLFTLNLVGGYLIPKTDPNLGFPPYRQLHHPAGDIKKVSSADEAGGAYSAITSTCYIVGSFVSSILSIFGVSNVNPNKICAYTEIPIIVIPKWDIGFSEGGSSGSPLFNNTQHVVGVCQGSLPDNPKKCFALVSYSAPMRNAYHGSSHVFQTLNGTGNPTFYGVNGKQKDCYTNIRYDTQYNDGTVYEFYPARDYQSENHLFLTATNEIVLGKGGTGPDAINVDIFSGSEFTFTASQIDLDNVDIFEGASIDFITPVGGVNCPQSAPDDYLTLPPIIPATQIEQFGLTSAQRTEVKQLLADSMCISLAQAEYLLNFTGTYADAQNDPQIQVIVSQIQNCANVQVPGLRNYSNTQPIISSTATLYPNPFKRSTGIALRLADACAVQAVVYDATMRPIATIAEGSTLAAGTHTLEWNASHIPAGIYIVRLQAGAFAQTFKVVKVE